SPVLASRAIAPAPEARGRSASWSFPRARAARRGAAPTPDPPSGRRRENRRRKAPSARAAREGAVRDGKASRRRSAHAGRAARAPVRTAPSQLGEETRDARGDDRALLDMRQVSAAWEHLDRPATEMGPEELDAGVGK